MQLSEICQLRLLPSLVLTIGILLSANARAEQRIAVLVADNEGWAQDPTLQHASDDVQRLEETLILVGAFAKKDIHVLISPTAEGLLSTLELLARDMKQMQGNILFLFYYSGHADQTYLHISGAPLSYQVLYEHLRALPAQLKIGILDACRSGGIISKGGQPAVPFSVKMAGSLGLYGTVLLTSSGADELSQERRALSGSVFSHHLVSGLRGAADDNGDWMVSLDEAYRYAYERTLVDTLSTEASKQQPRLQISLAGQGAIILTRLKEASSTLELPLGNWRCFVTDHEERRLIAEAKSESQRETLLALVPGSYVLKCFDSTGRLHVARLSAAQGERVRGDMMNLEEVATGEVLRLEKGIQQANAPLTEPARMSGSLSPATAQDSLWKLMLGLRGEVELLRLGITPALTWEFSRQRSASSAAMEFGGAVTALLQPTPGLRLEGSLSPYALNLSKARQVRLRVAMGATTFLPDVAVGGRLCIGLALRQGGVQFSTDAAYERIFHSRALYESSALLISLGVGWSSFAALR